MGMHKIHTDYGQQCTVGEFRLPSINEMKQIIADSRNTMFKTACWKPTAPLSCATMAKGRT